MSEEDIQIIANLLQVRYSQFTQADFILAINKLVELGIESIGDVIRFASCACQMAVLCEGNRSSIATPLQVINRLALHED